jgi:hypothetical protein
MRKKEELDDGTGAWERRMLKDIATAGLKEQYFFQVADLCLPDGTVVSPVAG